LESIIVTSDSIHRLEAAAALRSLDSRVSGLTASEASIRGREFGLFDGALIALRIGILHGAAKSRA
jgi:hypothetical protein